MKKYGIVSVSAVSATIACLLFGVSSALAATSLTSAVQANIYGGATTNATASSSSSANANVNVGLGGTYNSTNASSTASGNVNNGILNASINIGSNDAQSTAYAQSIAESDASVSAISTTDNNVSISYKVPVRLFGFIPVHETETASVDTSAQGSTPQVSIHRSWWSFLAAGNNSAEVSAFSAAVNDKLSASASASSQSDIMADIEAAAKSSMSASATGSASASTAY